MSINLLEGIRVLDVSEGIAAAYTTRLLADLGADVVLVEPPGGNPTRQEGPFPEDIADPEKSGTFLYLNLGKRSISLNLESEKGRNIFHRLSQMAHVLVEDVDLGARTELRLDPASLTQENPALVVTSISHMGKGGPYQNYLCLELTDMALSGQMNLLGRPDREPLKFGGNPGQFIGAFAAFGATMAAVYEAEDSGVGQQVEVSIREALALSHVELFCRYSYTGEVKERGYQQLVYPCKDGYISIQLLLDLMWPRICKLIGQPELADDPRFSTFHARRENAELLDTMIIQWTIERTGQEIYQQAQQARVSAGYLAKMPDILASPQLQFRGFFQQVAHPQAGTWTYPGTPFQMDGTSPILRPAPTVGEHNSAVLCQELGYSEAELEHLRRDGVI